MRLLSSNHAGRRIRLAKRRELTSGHGRHFGSSLSDDAGDFASVEELVLKERKKKIGVSKGWDERRKRRRTTNHLERIAFSSTFGVDVVCKGKEGSVRRIKKS